MDNWKSMMLKQEEKGISVLLRMMFETFIKNCCVSNKEYNYHCIVLAQRNCTGFHLFIRGWLGNQTKRIAASIKMHIWSQAEAWTNTPVDPWQWQPVEKTGFLHQNRFQSRDNDINGESAATLRQSAARRRRGRAVGALPPPSLFR